MKFCYLKSSIMRFSVMQLHVIVNVKLKLVNIKVHLKYWGKNTVKILKWFFMENTAKGIWWQIHYMNSSWFGCITWIITPSFTPMKNHFYENVILYSNKERTIIYKIVESFRLWINKSFHVKMHCHYALELIHDCVLCYLIECHLWLFILFSVIKAHFSTCIWIIVCLSTTLYRFKSLWCLSETWISIWNYLNRSLDALHQNALTLTLIYHE